MTDEDTAVTVDVLANDSDVEGDALSVTAASAGNGSVSIRPDGSLDYTPNSNFNGTDTVTYTISDGNGGTDTATATITVNPVNDGPVALDDTASVDEDGSVTIGVLANDSDLDGDALSVTAASASNGSVSIRPDGALDYTPNSNFNGTDTVTYTISDGNGSTDTATVTITVNPLNDTPVSRNDAYLTDEDVSLDVLVLDGVLGNASDVDGDILTALVLSEPSNGAISFNTDGSFTYTPDADFHGTDTFTYLASDGDVFSAPATVSITVNSVNDAPSLADIPDQSVRVGGTLTWTFAAADNDVPSNSLTYSLSSEAVSLGMTVDSTTGAFEWTPSAAYAGNTALVRVHVTDDGTPALSAQREFRVSVTAPNEAPQFNSTPIVDAFADQNYIYDSFAVDPDGDTLFYSLFAAPAGMSIEIDSGRISWVPSVIDIHSSKSVVVQVDDGKGGVAQQSFNLSIHPDPSNTPPIIVSDPELFHTISRPGSSPSGPTSPSSLNLNFEAGQVHKQEIAVDVLDVEPVTIAHVGVPVGNPTAQYLGQPRLPERVAQPDVDEARTRDLHRCNAVHFLNHGNQHIGNVPRFPAQWLGQHHGGIGGQVTM